MTDFVTKKARAGILRSLWCLMVATAVGTASVSAQGTRGPRPRLADFYERYIVETSFLTTREERLEFQSANGDVQREAIVAAVLESLDAIDRERLRRHQAERDEMNLRSIAQETAVLIAGRPAVIDRFADCGTLLRRLEVWRWAPWQVEREARLDGAGEVVVVFVQGSNFDPRSFRALSRPQGAPELLFEAAQRLSVEDVLETAREAGCLHGEQPDKLGRALESSLDLEGLSAAMPWWRTRTAGAILAAKSQAPLSSTQVERAKTRVVDGGARAEVTFEARYPGSYGGRTLIQGSLSVPAKRLHYRLLEDPAQQQEQANDRGGAPVEISDRVQVIGELYRAGRLVDSFEIRHLVFGATPAEGFVEFRFFRKAAAGRAQLRLRVDNARGDLLLRRDVDLDIPRLVQPAPPPIGRRWGYAQLVRTDLSVLESLPSVELRVVEPRGHSEVVRLEALIGGGVVGSVEFLFGGRIVGRADKWPFETFFELPTGLHELELEVRTLDEAGLLLATDTALYRRPEQELTARFADREPGDAVELQFHVSAPSSDPIVEIVCFEGETATRTTTDHHGGCPLPPPILVTPRTFVRVAVRTSSGATAEDVRFLGPQSAERVEVRLQEVMVSILDAARRPAEGLRESDLAVFEDGIRRPLVRVDPVDRLPLSVALLVDTSSSIGRRVRTLADSAERFFEELLRSEDRASVIGFHHEVRQLVEPTSDAHELALSLRDLRGAGGTRLFDAMMFALHSLRARGPVPELGVPSSTFEIAGESGGPGEARPADLSSSAQSRRAIIVLSDGADTDSDFGPEQVVAAARQAGVLVFPVALVDRELGPSSAATKGALASIADRSGGLLYEVGSEAALDRAFADIVALLRLQYLLVFEPLSELPASRRSAPGDPAGAGPTFSGGGAGEIEVRVSRPGASVRAVQRVSNH